MLPPGMELFCQIIEKTTLLKNIGLHESLAQCAFERVLKVVKVKLDQCLNLVQVKEQGNFRAPLSSSDVLKSDFGDRQAKRFVPILGNCVLVSVLWNHNLLLDRKRR